MPVGKNPTVCFVPNSNEYSTVVPSLNNNKQISAAARPSSRVARLPKFAFRQERRNRTGGL